MSHSLSCAAYGDWALDTTKYSYTVLTSVNTKSAAESACNGINGELVSIRSTAERDFVFALWAKIPDANVWTGYDAIEQFNLHVIYIYLAHR